ncbi:hypothetical protein KGP36_05555 [Patescibacteria group bacterium]|nr:hypothetical protein [Patescibacteria group bacterium]MDE1940705.1 hypothetical protein [Patescibacteria group bacterium]
MVIEKIVTRPIYVWGLAYMLQKSGVPGAFLALFAVNLGIALPLIAFQDRFEGDLLGIAVLRQGCLSKAREWGDSYTVWMRRLVPVDRWAEAIGRSIASFFVFALLLDQTDPLFSFLVYRREGEKGISVRGWAMLTYHNALVTAWWTFVQAILVKYIGMMFYSFFFAMFTRSYSH